MEIEIRRVADGTALVLPDDVAARLRLISGDKVTLTETPEGFIVTRSHADRVKAATRQVMAQYPETLKELAK